MKVVVNSDIDLIIAVSVAACGAFSMEILVFVIIVFNVKSFEEPLDDKVDDVRKAWDMMSFPVPLDVAVGIEHGG